MDRHIMDLLRVGSAAQPCGRTPGSDANRCGLLLLPGAATACPVQRGAPHPEHSAIRAIRVIRGLPFSAALIKQVIKGAALSIIISLTASPTLVSAANGCEKTLPAKKLQMS